MHDMHLFQFYLLSLNCGPSLICRHCHRRRRHSRSKKKSTNGEWHIYEEYYIQGGFNIVAEVI